MSTTDVREWAKAKGLTIGDHGRIPVKIQAEYDAEHATTADWPAAHVPGDPGLISAYDGGVTEADFPEPLAEPEHAAPVLSLPSRETRPRQITAPRRPLRDRLRRDPTAKPKAGKAKAKIPRVSLARLIEDAWGQLAFAAGPIPPMQRLLQAQAPMAGLVFEDTLRDTAVDRLLQPVARAEDKAKSVGGIVMPPVALLAVLASAPQPVERDGQWVYPEPSLQHKGALISLRWSLMLMAEAGSIRLDEYKERAEANTERGRQADQFMAWILGIEATPDVVDQAVSAEDEAVERARAMFGDNEA